MRKYVIISDERESVQKKTFQKWVNSHLVRVGCRINDLNVDMRDGKMLIKLLEVLSGERLVSIFCLIKIFKKDINFVLIYYYSLSEEHTSTGQFEDDVLISYNIIS